MLTEMLLITGALIGIKKITTSSQRLKLKPAKSFRLRLSTKKPKKPKKTTKLKKTTLLKEVVLIPFTGGKVRRQQLDQMATKADDEQKAFNQKINKNLRYSIGLIGLSVLGAWLSPPLQLLTIA